MNVERSELQGWGRRGFLRAAASSPLLWGGLRQQRAESVTGPDCARETISIFDALLKHDREFVILDARRFPVGLLWLCAWAYTRGSTRASYAAHDVEGKKNKKLGT